MTSILNKKLLRNSWFIYRDLRNIKKYEIVSKISRNMKSLDFIQQFTYRELARSSYKNCGIVGQFPKSRVWATFLHCIHSTVQQAYAGHIQNSGTAPESLYWHFHAPVSPSNFSRISRKKKMSQVSLKLISDLFSKLNTFCS